MALRSMLLAVFLLAPVFAWPVFAWAETRLLMLDRSACEWCERWDAEVGIVYAMTAEGKRAPLLRSNIFESLPEGIVLTRRAHFTPTFVLVKDGAEIGRIEGYPGEDFFYGMLQQMLDRAAKPES
ncbi:MAG TPA: hypothetical protein VMY41_00295 [Thermohalobaculum sp.]|nr:hypothetical protein [Thermohalobaculum sp.]